VIAACFVQKNGVYFGLPNVDPYDLERDAFNYLGPWPAICHPPCERWGKYWSGGPSAKKRRTKGDDGGCFAMALVIIRRFGGIIEHPGYSHAWEAFKLPRPAFTGGWSPPDEYGGRSCYVEQGHYGHPARKGTYLYAILKSYPDLRWGRFEGGKRLDEGFHSNQERAEARLSGRKPLERLSKDQRSRTPIGFRDLLISLVESK
jgi:hypothetical protein